MDGLKIVVQKMGSADIDEPLMAAALLAERDYVALLGSETGKLVAAVGKSGLAKGVKAGSINPVSGQSSQWSRLVGVRSLLLARFSWRPIGWKRS